LVGLAEVTNDLHLKNTTQGYIGLYPLLKEQNIKRELLVEEQANLMIDILNYEADFSTWTIAYDEANEELNNKTVELHRLTTHDYEWFLDNREDSWWNNEEALSILTAIARLKSNIKRYEILKETAESNLKSARELKESIDNELEQIVKVKEVIISKFYTKYSRFIQEGSWISEDYVDDNLYYLDAENTLHVSSQPKVTYTINVLELS
jgi:hypothetical protein